MIPLNPYRRLIIVLISLILIVFLSGLSFGETEKINLRLKLNQGEQYKISVVETDKYIEERRKDRWETITIMEIGYSFEVTEVDSYGLIEDYWIKDISGNTCLNINNGWPVSGVIRRFATGAKKSDKTWEVLWQTTLKFTSI